MPDAETTDRFVMYGARAVLDAGAVHIERQISALESAVMANAGLVFDLAKTLIESACKTVLSERKFDYDGGWDLPRLLKETLGQLRLVPEGLDGEQEVSDSLRKTAGGLQTAIQGICELRNHTVSLHTAGRQCFNNWSQSRPCWLRGHLTPLLTFYSESTVTTQQASRCDLAPTTTNPSSISMWMSFMSACASLTKNSNRAKFFIRWPLNPIAFT